MRKFIVFVLLLAVIAAAAYYTKPSDEKCLQQAKAAVKSQVSGDYNTKNTVVHNVLDKVIEKAIRIEDKVFYKSIAYSFGGKRKQIGWGAFGMVNIVAYN